MRAPITPGELAGNHPPGVVDERLGQDDRRGQVVAGSVSAPATAAIDGQSPGCGPVRVEPWRQIRPARQHDVVAGRMIVRAVRERPDQRPQMAPLRPGGADARRSRFPESSWRSGRNSPRISAGASGFRSKLSSCDNPPERKIKMTEGAFAVPV